MALVADKSLWNTNSRVYRAGKVGRRQKYAGDFTIGAQNYEDEHGVFQEIDLTPTWDGEKWIIDKAPYILQVWPDGTRYIQPDRFNSKRSIKFAAPKVMEGRTLVWDKDKFCSRAVDYDIKITPGNTRIGFVQRLYAPQADKFTEFSYTSKGITQVELRAMLGKPKLIERGGAKTEREMLVTVDGSMVRLDYDDTGLDYSLGVDVDPDLDFQPTAGNQDGYFNQFGSGYNNSNSFLIFGKVSGSQFIRAFIYIPAITIPAGATITAATLTTISIQISTSNPELDIFTEDDPNPSTVTSGADGLTRVLDSETVHWTLPTPVGVDDVMITPDITDILQQRIDGIGWASNNTIGFFLVAFDNATPSNDLHGAWSYDGDPAKSVQLNAEWTTGTPLLLEATGQSVSKGTASIFIGGLLALSATGKSISKGIATILVGTPLALSAIGKSISKGIAIFSLFTGRADGDPLPNQPTTSGTPSATPTTSGTPSVTPTTSGTIIVS